MHSLIRRLYLRLFVIFRTSTSALEFLNALYLLAWAAVLLFGRGVYELNEYASFLDWPSWVLILAFGGTGIGLLCTMLYRSERSDIFAGFFMLCAGVVWVAVAGAFALSHPPLHPVLTLHPLLATVNLLAGVFLIESAKTRRKKAARRGV